MATTSRRAEVAAALRDAGEPGISGETIGAAIGISRVAVSKHVATLRSLGYEIRSAPRSGYRLISAPDECLPEEVGPRLRNTLWVSCDGGPLLASTNDEAKRLARAGAGEGAVVVAGSQTGGRGRFGRTWESPQGGAYVSAILRPPLSPAEIAPLSLVVAVGAARGLSSLGAPVGLKWPNDLEIGGRKVGGILLEMAAEIDRVEWVVAGCGVNVKTAAHARAARLRDVIPSALVPEVAAAVLDGIAGAYRELLECGFGVLRAEYEARSVLTDRDVTVRDATGAPVASGRVAGIDRDGALLLSSGDGEVRVSAGEVTIAR